MAPGENEFDSGFEMVNHGSADDTSGATNGASDFHFNTDGNFYLYF
jgi:hypothetical protein